MQVTSVLWYLKDLPIYKTTKPYVVHLPANLVPVSRRTNQDCGAYPGIPIRDIRTAGQAFSLDRHGFELTTSASIPLTLAYDEFRDPAKVKNLYCESVKAALLRKTGAEFAHLLHRVIRRRHHSFPEQPRGNAEAETDQPVQGVHCDYTPKQAYESLQEAVGPETATSMWNSRRIAIIQGQNARAWRPLRGPVLDWPLAVCDATSVDRDDLVATDNVWSYGVSDTYNVLHRPCHAWYYADGQTSEDVLLFKGFDNAAGVSSFCPHAAFPLGDGSTTTASMRESVECAILLVYPEETT